MAFTLFYPATEISSKTQRTWSVDLHEGHSVPKYLILMSEMFSLHLGVRQTPQGDR